MSGAPPRLPAAFLDRDGVLNLDRGYLWNPAELEWVPGAMEAVRRLNAAGYRVIVVTNQSGIARDLYTEAQLRTLMDWMVAELAEAGARLDAWYYCPHHPEGTVEAYRKSCDCRKPAPGMLLRAMRDWPTHPAKSFLVGDRDSDLEAARAAGIDAFRFRGGNLAAFLEGKLPGF
jgi:D-glycero-D-manno-heptose 1,7-bisphosphate phosphatase